MGEVGRFLVTQWVDGCVVFDRQFGDTHALDPAVAAIFLCIENGERDRSALIAKNASFYPEISNQFIESQLDGTLVHLEALGLVKANIN